MFGDQVRGTHAGGIGTMGARPDETALRSDVRVGREEVPAFVARRSEPFHDDAEPEIVSGRVGEHLRWARVVGGRRPGRPGRPRW